MPKHTQKWKKATPHARKREFDNSVVGRINPDIKEIGHEDPSPLLRALCLLTRRWTSD
jgi:hypothetical protein